MTMNRLPLCLLIGIGCFSLANAEKIKMYVGNGASDGIVRMVVDTESGDFSDMAIAAPANSPSFMVFSKDEKFGYSANKTKASDGKLNLGGVSAYSRTADGSLELLGSRLTGGTGACHVSLDQTGSCLFVANYSSGNVASYKVAIDGRLSPVVSMIDHAGSGPHPQRQQAAHAHSIYPSPDNQFVYAADLGTDTIEVYSLNPESAELENVSSAKCPAGSGPRHMCFSPDGSLLYALNEMKPSISVFQRNSESGKLSLVGTTMLLAEGTEGITSSEILLSDDGRFLYAANRDLKREARDSLSIVAVGDGGSLEHLKNVPLGVSIPRHFAITADGKMLVVAAQDDNAVVSYHRDPSSGMVKPTGKSIEVKKPMWIGFVRP